MHARQHVYAPNKKLSLVRFKLQWMNSAHPASRSHFHAPAGGRITGQFVKAVIRASGSKLPVSLTSYAVVGAAAYMGGATRMTLTTTVMVMETTGALQLIVPIMITVFVAKVRLTGLQTLES